MILKLLLNTQMIWMIPIEILKKTNKRRKILIVFDNMIADMLSNKKFNPIVAELFRKRGRKLNIYFVFITQSYFVVPKKYQTKFYSLFNYDYCK